MNSVSINKQSGRLLSLDILRGITIAGMIMVNNPGAYQYIYKPLGHASWHGITPTDLVFPFFMFIMGVSMYMSFRKFDFKATKTSILKIIKRTVLLFLVGMAGLGNSPADYQEAKTSLSPPPILTPYEFWECCNVWH